MLEVKEIYKAYRDHQVLKGASFKVDNGQIFGLIGKNGAGKTTLLNIIAGSLKKDGGEISFGTSGKVGYLPDLPVFFEYMKAGEYLDFLLMESGRKSGASGRRELLELVKLPANVTIEKMSRGMRQRLGIAAALSGNPDIVLLDEPTSALDPKGREDVMNILRELKAQKKTVVFSTHILNDMEQICDDFGFLHDGIITPRSELLPENEFTLFVSFAKAVEISENALPGIRIEVVTDKAYRFIIKDASDLTGQKRVLDFIGALGVTVRNITNETLTLDALFKEVCD